MDYKLHKPTQEEVEEIFKENKIKENKIMNNKTIKKFNIIVKLRGDNVYDLYIDNHWVSSRGSCDMVAEDIKNEIKRLG